MLVFNFILSVYSPAFAVVTRILSIHTERGLIRIIHSSPANPTMAMNRKRKDPDPSCSSVDAAVPKL